MRFPRRSSSRPVCTSPLSMPTSLVVQMSSDGPKMMAPVRRSPRNRSLRYCERVRAEAADDLGARVVPRAERRDVEVADLHDVHEEAAAVGDVAARHVGADDAAVLLGGRLDGVHLGSAGDEVPPRAPRRRPRTRSGRSSAGGRRRRCRPARPAPSRRPSPSSHSRFVRMPVAMMTTSATMGSPVLKRELPLALRVLDPVTVVPARMVTPCLRATPSTSAAHVSSTMRGRMRGATSTMVSLAPRARIEFRIVNEMKPAPTITTCCPA